MPIINISPKLAMNERSFHILTFGCQMNVNDSEWLAGVLKQRGFEELPLLEARVVILNTCSVREKAEHKVHSMLGRIQQLRSKNAEGVFAVVTGCVAQQLGRTLLDRFALVRMVLGTDQIPLAPEYIEKLCTESKLRLCLTDFMPEYPERMPLIPPLPPDLPAKPLVTLSATNKGALHPDDVHQGKLPSGSPTPEQTIGLGVGQAFVNIMQGCDNFCAYCIVPYTRGRQKSRSPESVLAECRQWLDRGVKELTLLGQNVNAYGKDAAVSGYTFTHLLQDVAGLHGLERLRFMTAHPKDLAPECITAFGSLPVLCPRLHLPLQTGSDTVLKRMGRKYTLDAFCALVNALRAVRPDMAFSTDLIVGFPGETEEDFQCTLAAMERIGFMASFSFCYSDRPGTRASFFTDKISSACAHKRLITLQALQDRLSDAWLARRVGQKTTLFLEAPQRGTDGLLWQGRDPYGCPVYVPLDPQQAGSGKSVNVRITAAKKNSLCALEV